MSLGINSGDILQKLITQRGNWPTKIKMEQRRKSAVIRSDLELSNGGVTRDSCLGDPDTATSRGSRLAEEPGKGNLLK